ncbi:relaxase/mobilization nuclease domain-containing protein [Polynucleobacter sp. 86C-FISCH]|uniref:TraI/MobA(P) family conjugative relaxase n=1 Tax=Polynucleobacter sp. 86C-FISCH TaxID=2689101 RepID=UPI001C0C62B5|nr:TraI/MobA(P) family conjugative relaxase [Polynucleobacter sp. 86C-FISCH]MBU3595081.1 relaxase/mobilization nuclease domain-containing protein [Polynucleobacter sp. 86C-FISCH]
MLAKVIGLSKGGVVSAQKVLAYLGRDGADQANELIQFGTPEMGAINLDANLITAQDRKDVAELWDSMVSNNHGIRSNPFYHVALNWQEGEHPDAEHVQNACKHVMQALGMQECDAVWAIHRDTDNDHVHLVINRVRSEDFQLVHVPAWDYLKLDKAMRELEIEQGWSHSNGPWIALEVEGKTEIVRMSRKERRARGLLQDANLVSDGSGLTQAAIRSEKNSGDDSFQRWVAGSPSMFLKQLLNQDHPNWQMVHECLATQGLRITPKGSGMIVIGLAEDGSELAAKASQLGRFATKAALEKALGPYEPSNSALKLETNAYLIDKRGHLFDKGPVLFNGQAAPFDVGADIRAEKVKARADARLILMERFELDQAQKKATRISLRTEMREAHALEKNALRVSLKDRRQAARLIAKSKGRDVGIALSLFAFEAAKEREALLSRQAAERKALTAHVSRNQVLRNWLETEALSGDAAAQSALRGIIYREQREKKLKESAIEGQEQGVFKKMDLSQLHAEVDARCRRITYRNQTGQKQFTDTGPRIEVHIKTGAGLDAALKVAAQKYGGRITLTGSGAFREQAARAATRLGITVLDKDLASVVSNERQASQYPAQKPPRNTTPAVSLGGSRGKKDKGNER